MHHKQGEDRNQMFMFSLESVIAFDSFVRVADTFVDAIDLKSFGFLHLECEAELLQTNRACFKPCGSFFRKMQISGYTGNRKF